MTTTVRNPKDPTASTPSPRELPPEWAVERLVKSVGRGPAAAGRALDKAAKVPVLGWVVRRFSSVWFGIILLALIGVYIAFGSGLPRVRASFEMTDLQFFDAMPMRILLGLLAADLIVVTLRRIPFTLFKLGPWIVHVGILTMITGCVIYFSMKEEGSVRLYLNKPNRYVYDVTERALYAFKMNPDGTFDQEHPIITPIPALPIYNEHLEDEDHHNPLDLTLPASALPGGVGVRVTGFYPFADLEVAEYRAAAAGAHGAGPAIAMSLETPRERMPENWLLGDSPAKRVLELKLPFSVEYLWHPTAQRLKDLQTSFEGLVAITVRVPKFNVEKTYVMQEDVPIAVEGTPYTITPQELGDIPLVSAGYEGATSSNVMVAVTRKDGDKSFEFNRMCLSRYPERSPDFVMENGKQTRKQGGVDPDIEIIFHDARATQAWVVEGENGSLTAVVRTRGGKSTSNPLKVGADADAVDMPVTEIPGLKLRVTKLAQNVEPIYVPRIIPVEARPRGQSVMELLDLSLVDLEIKLPGGGGAPHLYVPFVPFATFSGEGNRPPVELSVVSIAGVGKYGLVLSTTRRDLPETVTLVDFKPLKFPGAVHSYMDYVSTLQFGTGEKAKTGVARLNQPAYEDGLTFFQSQWDGDENASADKRFSVVGVGNRPGLMVMVSGAILIAIGIGYAFYAKPLLLKYKKESLAAWNAARRPKTTTT